MSQTAKNSLNDQQAGTKKPLDTNNTTSIYNAQVTPKNSSSNTKTNVNDAKQQQIKKPVNQTTNNNATSTNNNKNNAQTPNRQISPTRFSDGAGTRIAKRELWWKEPPPSQVKIQVGSNYKLENVAPKVDHRNANYSPTRASTKIIDNKKLEWQAAPTVDTWGNFKHQPGGGNKKYPSENLQWPATPKVDSGFIYTFE